MLIKYSLNICDTMPIHMWTILYYYCHEKSLKNIVSFKLTGIWICKIQLDIILIVIQSRHLCQAKNNNESTLKLKKKITFIGEFVWRRLSHCNIEEEKLWHSTLWDCRCFGYDTYLLGNWRFFCDWISRLYLHFEVFSFVCNRNHTKRRCEERFAF